MASTRRTRHRPDHTCTRYPVPGRTAAPRGTPQRPAAAPPRERRSPGASRTATARPPASIRRTPGAIESNPGARISTQALLPRNESPPNAPPIEPTRPTRNGQIAAFRNESDPGTAPRSDSSEHPLHTPSPRTPPRHRQQSRGAPIKQPGDWANEQRSDQCRNRQPGGRESGFFRQKSSDCPINTHHYAPRSRATRPQTTASMTIRGRLAVGDRIRRKVDAAPPTAQGSTRTDRAGTP